MDPGHVGGDPLLGVPMSDLSEVEAGDTLMITSRGHRSLKKVERTTKTLIILDGQSMARYKRHGGRMIGATVWDTAYLSVPTPKDIAEIAHSTLSSEVYRLSTSVRLYEVSYERLLKIREWLREV